MRWLINFILSPYTKYKRYKYRKQKIKELKDKDPFIYE